MNRIKKTFAGGTALAFLVALVLAPIPAYAEDEPGASSEIVVVDDTTTTEDTAPTAVEEEAVVEEAEATEEEAIIATDPEAEAIVIEEVAPLEDVMAALRVAPANNGGANNTNGTQYWENLYSDYNAVCYKHDDDGGAHGTVVGQEVQLQPYGNNWYGSGYVVLIVNGGSNDAIYEFPVPGDQNYVSPLNGGGNIPDVSHWTICKGDLPEPELLVATAPLTIKPATCDAGEILVWGVPVNAAYTKDSTPDGTEGPADYNVVANADKGAEFEPGITQLVWEDELAGPLTGPECDEVEPLVALAPLTTTPATCDAGEILVYGEDVENASFTEDSTPSGTEGPADYNVVANADKGAEFEPGITQLVWEDELAGPLTGPECDEVTPGTQTATVVGQCVPADDETDGGPIALLNFFNTFDVTKPFYVFANGELYNAEPVLVPADSSIEDAVIGFNEDEYDGSVVISVYDGPDPLTANLLAEATVDTDCVTNIVMIPIPAALELLDPTCDDAGSIKGIDQGLPHGEGWSTEMNPAFTGAGTYMYRFVVDGDIPFVGGLTATEWVELVVQPQQVEGCPTTDNPGGASTGLFGDEPGSNGWPLNLMETILMALGVLVVAAVLVWAPVSRARKRSVGNSATVEAL